jgi:hypothetical protein
MQALAQLVNDSLARYDLETKLDLRRLRWSVWLRCDGQLNVLHAPAKPGLLAFAEEIVSPSPLAIHGKRFLALFQITETPDVGMALARTLLPGSGDRARFASGHCFARYVVIEDADQRQAALAAFQEWMSYEVSQVGTEMPFFMQSLKAMSTGTDYLGDEMRQETGSASVLANKD